MLFLAVVIHIFLADTIMLSDEGKREAFLLPLDIKDGFAASNFCIFRFQTVQTIL